MSSDDKVAMHCDKNIPLFATVFGLSLSSDSGQNGRLGDSPQVISYCLGFLGGNTIYYYKSSLSVLLDWFNI